MLSGMFTVPCIEFTVYYYIVKSINYYSVIINRNSVCVCVSLSVTAVLFPCPRSYAILSYTIVRLSGESSDHWIVRVFYSQLELVLLFNVLFL